MKITITERWLLKRIDEAGPGGYTMPVKNGRLTGRGSRSFVYLDRIKALALETHSGKVVVRLTRAGRAMMTLPEKGN